MEGLQDLHPLLQYGPHLGVQIKETMVNVYTFWHITSIMRRPFWIWPKTPFLHFLGVLFGPYPGPLPRGYGIQETICHQVGVLRTSSWGIRGEVVDYHLLLLSSWRSGMDPR